MWSLDEEREFREDLISKVVSGANEGDGTLLRSELGAFEYGLVRIRLIDEYGGIWNPGASWKIGEPLRATLSINTSNKSKYNDQELPGGLWRYDYQSGTIQGKNAKMRKAMELQMPLLWFVQQQSGGYIPYRVFIIDDHPDYGFCSIAPDLSLAQTRRSESVIEKKYAERMMKQRLHQPAFRSRVLRAYDTKCAVCSLGHGALLDAAHITPDSWETSTTSVSNGMSLCKMHHAAYDVDILGIDSDFQVHIRHDILSEIDGPMLQHGLKEMQGRRISVPRHADDIPDRDRLDLRYKKFLSH